MKVVMLLNYHTLAKIFVSAKYRLLMENKYSFSLNCNKFVTTASGLKFSATNLLIAQANFRLFQVFRSRRFFSSASCSCFSIKKIKFVTEAYDA